MDLLDVLFAALGIGVLSLLTLVYQQFTYWSRRGVPHLDPVPILGHNATVFFRRRAFPKFIEHIYSRYPKAKYVGLMDFNTPTILLRDPELLKEVCIKNFEHFPNHRAFVDEDVDPVFGRMIFLLRDERWREMRNILSPSFTASKMRFLFQLVAKCSHDFVDYLLEHPEETKSIEMKDTFTRYTNDVIATSAFGISVNSMKDKTNEFYKRGKDASSFGSPVRLIKFLIFRMCPALMRLSGEKFLSRDTNRFFKNLVSDTVRTREEQGIVRPDMIHLLMQARDKENGTNMTIDDMVAQAFIFFLAGFDTSSTLMCFAAYELAVNPDIQQRLRDEVDQFASEADGEITYEMLQKMKYMDMVISEALRKYPPAPLMDRTCSKEFTLPESMPGYKEFVVKPKTLMWLPIYGVHHDPNYYPDPEKFDPERFSDENKSKIVPYAYLPFGIGPRSCIGNRFALMETKILLAHLLQKFVLKPIDKTPIPMIFSKRSFTMIAKDGFWLQLEPREILKS